MSFSKDFLRFSRECKELDIDRVHNLQIYLKSLPPKQLINAEDLSQQLELTYEKSNELLAALERYKILGHYEYCNECDEKLPVDSLVCPECGHDNKSGLLFEIYTDKRTEELAKNKISEAVYELDAKLMCNSWEKRNYIVYFFVDILGSREKQRQNDAVYRDFKAGCYKFI